MRRIVIVLRAGAVLVDVNSCTLVISVLYLFDAAGEPSGRQTFSGIVGKAAFDGKGWGIRAERIIDGLMGRGHCLECYLKGQAE